MTYTVGKLVPTTLKGIEMLYHGYEVDEHTSLNDVQVGDTVFMSNNYSDNYFYTVVKVTDTKLTLQMTSTYTCEYRRKDGHLVGLSAKERSWSRDYITVLTKAHIDGLIYKKTEHEFKKEIERISKMSLTVEQMKSIVDFTSKIQVKED